MPVDYKTNMSDSWGGEKHSHNPAHIGKTREGLIY